MMITKKCVLPAIILGSLFLGGNNVKAQSKQEVSSAVTRKVFEHHMMAFSKGDVDETLKDYAEDAVIIVEGVNEKGYVKGLKEIKKQFETVYKDYFPPATTNLKVKTVTIVGEVAYLTWETSKTDFTTDTYIIRNGKIVAQTFAAKFK
ncbi:ketosteroid isomerase-like protein [Chryseobacterium rhizosphaerae]|uniref:Ketosteroid isomerase-like protein n=1 Tax=Chryseobacterium rhizosphaerae TaxID=395937 RepID=A0AAE4C1N8_9FLAO|nr:MULTISPECIES: nuclear transport factor 2 family protein [Chryseobacterium]MBL3547994.1 nuclear transport factor 2 family protein [Chryseobacterium sp. KMC2]MDR6525678.1 ketosteroid isomerase-like protein [Chryseobacterium rhizosphaerae]